MPSQHLKTTPSQSTSKKKEADPADDLQMSLPLFSSFPNLKENKQPEWVEWAEEDWVYLHGALLERSLHDLTVTNAGKSLVGDIVTWICEPIVPYGTVPRPFSFQACSELQGLDPEELQLTVLKDIQGLSNNRVAINAVRGYIEKAVLSLEPA